MAWATGLEATQFWRPRTNLCEAVAKFRSILKHDDLRVHGFDVLLTPRPGRPRAYSTSIDRPGRFPPGAGGGRWRQEKKRKEKKRNDVQVRFQK